MFEGCFGDFVRFSISCCLSMRVLVLWCKHVPARARAILGAEPARARAISALNPKGLVPSPALNPKGLVPPPALNPQGLVPSSALSPQGLVPPVHFCTKKAQDHAQFFDLCYQHFGELRLIAIINLL